MGASLIIILLLMSAAPRRRFTREDDLVIMQTVLLQPMSVRCALQQVADKLQLPLSKVQNRYYHMRKMELRRRVQNQVDDEIPEADLIPLRRRRPNWTKEEKAIFNEHIMTLQDSLDDLAALIGTRSVQEVRQRFYNFRHRDPMARELLPTKHRKGGRHQYPKERRRKLRPSDDDDDDGAAASFEAESSEELKGESGPDAEGAEQMEHLHTEEALGGSDEAQLDQTQDGEDAQETQGGDQVGL